MQLYHISIPAKPHIAPFAHKRYGKPVLLNGHSSLGIFIKVLLNNPQYKSKFNISHQDIRFKYLTDSIQCAVPYSHIMRNEVYTLTSDHIIAINQYLEEEFKERLFFHCQLAANWQRRRAGIDNAIQSFSTFYNIPIDTAISFDALKKIEYRYRQKKHENIFTQMSFRKIACQTA